MKKNIVIGLVVLVVVLIGGFFWSRFCNTGRYQIAFGNVQKIIITNLWPEDTGEQYTRTEEEHKTVPVCFKIDTLTGRTWVYYYSAMNDRRGLWDESEFFEEIRSKDYGE